MARERGGKRIVGRYAPQHNASWNSDPEPSQVSLFSVSHVSAMVESRSGFLFLVRSSNPDNHVVGQGRGRRDN